MGAWFVIGHQINATFGLDFGRLLLVLNLVVLAVVMIAVTVKQLSPLATAYERLEALDGWTGACVWKWDNEPRPGQLFYNRHHNHAFIVKSGQAAKDPDTLAALAAAAEELQRDAGIAAQAVAVTKEPDVVRRFEALEGTDGQVLHVSPDQLVDAFMEQRPTAGALQ